jgi:DNA-binding GntR family transcriptional regulator
MMAAPELLRCGGGRPATLGHRSPAGAPDARGVRRGVTWKDEPYVDLLDRKTASRGVAERLREEIQRGDLRPGDRLRQGDVARRFGVSTTPVREAFALLQAQGLVRVDPHRGAVVFRPSVDDVRELYEIRTALETLAIDKAVDNVSGEAVEELQSLLDQMAAASGERWSELHNRFHLRLYSLAGRPRLSSLIANMRDSSSAYINMFVADAHGAEISQLGHQEMVDACRNRNKSAARRAVLAHLGTAVQKLVASLDEPDADVSGVA